MAVGGLIAKTISQMKASPKSTVAFGGVGVFSGYSEFSEEYGGGAAIAMGLAEMALTLPLGIVGNIVVSGGSRLTHAALSYGYKSYFERQRVNMGSPASIHDRFGTLATMRQRSMENMSRGRASLGNEARLHHY